MSFPRSRKKPRGGFHTPEKSGVPSACRGGGALRFGLPSAPSGTCGAGTLLHWAETTHESRSANPNWSRVFIVASPSAVARKRAGDVPPARDSWPTARFESGLRSSEIELDAEPQEPRLDDGGGTKPGVKRRIGVVDRLVRRRRVRVHQVVGVESDVRARPLDADHLREPHVEPVN